jgi:hypothetical protein
MGNTLLAHVLYSCNLRNISEFNELKILSLNSEILPL